MHIPLITARDGWPRLRERQHFWNLMTSPEMSKAYSVPEKTKGSWDSDGSRALLLFFYCVPRCTADGGGVNRSVAVLRGDVLSAVTRVRSRGMSTSPGRRLERHRPQYIELFISREAVAACYIHVKSTLRPGTSWLLSQEQVQGESRRVST